MANPPSLSPRSNLSPPGSPTRSAMEPIREDRETATESEVEAEAENGLETVTPMVTAETVLMEEGELMGEAGKAKLWTRE